MSERGNIGLMAQAKKYKQVLVTLESEAQHRELKKLAQAWADQVKSATGATIAQPVSGYVRWLIRQDAERRGAK